MSWTSQMRAEAGALVRARWADPEQRRVMLDACRAGQARRLIVATPDMLATIHDCNDRRFGMERTAEMIGVARKTLERLLREHGITWKRSVARGYRATPEVRQEPDAATGCVETGLGLPCLFPPSDSSPGHALAGGLFCGEGGE